MVRCCAILLLARDDPLPIRLFGTRNAGDATTALSASRLLEPLLDELLELSPIRPSAPTSGRARPANASTSCRPTSPPPPCSSQPPTASDVRTATRATHGERWCARTGLLQRRSPRQLGRLDRAGTGRDVLRGPATPADIATDLTSRLDALRCFGKVIEDPQLAWLWTASNDARNYVVIGDPAVRAW
jgi:hypothetical protein